jgi:quercetin dioxygenase-like cupin family protein
MKLIMMAVSIIGISSAMAQDGAKRTMLSTQDFPAGYQTVKGYAELPRGTCSGRHTHPGIETSYVLDGELTLTIDGQPPKIYKAGDAFQLDEVNVVHNGCATGDRAVKILAIHIIEKGKPLVSLVK